MPLIQERLEKIQTLSLKAGAHSPNSTFCILEAVAFVAGEPWSDHPECACPVIGAFLRSWNDSLQTDADRDRLLKPIIRDLVGSKSTKEVEEKRALLCADWLVRVNTPTWLRLAGLTVHADALEALPEITSFAQVPSICGLLEAARQDTAAARAAAWAAAWAAAGDAARAAAWDAAWAAAGNAAWDAAGAEAGNAAWDAAGAEAGNAAWDAAGAEAGNAAWDAAGAEAGNAAWAAAWAAAGAAAWDAAWAAEGNAAGAAAGAKLKPTVTALQESALALVKKMLAVAAEG